MGTNRKIGKNRVSDNYHNSKSNVFFFNEGQVYNTNHSSPRKGSSISLAPYEGFRNLVLDQNLFLVAVGATSSVVDTTYRPLKASYNQSTGVLSINDTGSASTFTEIRFKILIIE